MNSLSDHACSAEILRASREQDLARLRSLRDQGHEAIDTLHTQLSDLVQTRQPQRKMDPAQVRDAVSAFLDERGPHYGVWAHYPWSRRLVRVLEEEEFVALRTDRNQHKITAQEQARLRDKKIGVVGLSVGQSVALTLALERSCGELRLADFDAIDLSNLNRLRCGVHNIGLPKAVVAAREIAELDPYLTVVCFNQGYNDADGEAFLEGLDAVVDECDSLDVKLRLRDAARARRIPVLMNTSDRGMTDIERFDLEPDRAIFHGRLKGIRPDTLAGLSTEEKVPIVLDIIGVSSSSVRLRASMMEIEQSIKTWPQLASDVTLGGAIICDVARRMLLGQRVGSGRYYVDLAEVGGHREPQPRTVECVDAFMVQAHTASDVPLSALDRIIADAVLAPSAGNVQPWRWSKTEKSLKLEHRRAGQVSILYHDDKAAMVGLGATLESAIISARHHGFEVDATIDPHASAVASLRLAECESGSHEPLHAQLARRRSVRTRPKAVMPLPGALPGALRAQTDRFPGLRFAYLSERAAIETLAALVGEAERLRILDPDSHADMVRELAWSEQEHRCSGEGIPLSSLSLSAAEEAGLQVVRDPDVMTALAEWDLGGGLAKLAHELVSSSSAIGLLWAHTGTHDDYLSGGRALQRVWLEAARADVGICPVTSLCYLLSAWRVGRPVTALQAAALPDIDRRFRAIFELPESRADIALFRLLPAGDELDSPRSTLRRRA